MRLALRSIVLMGLLGVGCRPSPEECKVVVDAMYEQRDMIPYFAVVSEEESRASCLDVASRDTVACVRKGGDVYRCPKVDEIAFDTGWQTGAFCFKGRAEGERSWSRGRCEGSNRECTYYRRVVRRDQPELEWGRCDLYETIWAVPHATRGFADPSPTRATCEWTRRESEARGHTLEPCAEVVYRDGAMHRR